MTSEVTVYRNNSSVELHKEESHCKYGAAMRGLTFVTVAVMVWWAAVNVSAGTSMQEQADVIREAGYVVPLVIHFGEPAPPSRF